MWLSTESSEKRPTVGSENTGHTSLSLKKSRKLVLLPIFIRDTSLILDMFVPDGSPKAVTDTLVSSLVVGTKRSWVLCFGFVPISPIVTLRVRSPLSFSDMREYPEPGYGSLISSVESLTCSKNETPTNRSSSK